VAGGLTLAGRFAVVASAWCADFVLHIMDDQIEAHCPRCAADRAFTRCRPQHRTHFILSVCTLGLWAFVWLSRCVGAAMRPWRCERCGWHKPEFRTLKKPTPVAMRDGVPGEFS
jgi:predicted Zn-ribbon and HTH transcriptional regulator